VRLYQLSFLLVCFFMFFSMKLPPYVPWKLRVRHFIVTAAIAMLTSEDTHNVLLAIRQLLVERTNILIPRYEKIFAERGGITPSDPLMFHLYHLARYWTRLAGFSKQNPSNPAAFIESDLGACILVGSEFANKLIEADSPIYGRWQEYSAQTKDVLYKRPVNIEAIEAASGTFNACLAELKYDPWI